MITIVFLIISAAIQIHLLYIFRKPMKWKSKKSGHSLEVTRNNLVMILDNMEADKVYWKNLAQSPEKDMTKNISLCIEAGAEVNTLRDNANCLLSELNTCKARVKALKEEHQKEVEELMASAQSYGDYRADTIRMAAELEMKRLRHEHAKEMAHGARVNDALFERVASLSLEVVSLKTPKRRRNRDAK